MFIRLLGIGLSRKWKTLSRPIPDVQPRRIGRTAIDGLWKDLFSLVLIVLRSACHGAVKRHVPFSQPGALPRRSKTPFATLGFPHGQYKQIPSFTISISIDVTPGEAHGTGYKAGQACPGTVIMLRSLGGGARRDRTDDLKLAKLPLSQLSYGPNRVSVIRSQGSGKEPVLIPDFRLPIPDPGGPGKTRTSDLTLIKRAL